MIDIDPPEGVDVATLRDVARRLRDLFSSIGLTPFLQATGGRGYHVVAALDRSDDYRFVRALATDMAVAPYSTRARPGAPVATPLDWSELGRSTPDGYDIHNLRRRLARKADPWSTIGQHAAAPATVRGRLDDRGGG
jgi:bifunctional non-homologous end joining protein LigD